jgi:alpha-tubulin suppressor-like RCC1 family protein
MRFLEVPALITEDIEDPNIVDITEDITASISGTTLTIDGDSKVSGEVTITLTNDVTVNTVTTSNIRQPSIHKIIIKTNGAGNFTYVPNAGVTASSVSTTTKTGSDLDILLITTSGGDTYLDLDLADYVSPAANFSNVVTGFKVSELTSTYGTTAKLYKPDGTLLTTVNSAATESGVNFGYTESSPGDVIYKLEVTDDLGRKSTYNLPRKWINYAMETTSTPGFQKFALSGNDYTTTVTLPSLGSSSKARIHKTTDHGYMGINFKIQGRNSPSGAWVDIDSTAENVESDESAEFLAFGDYLYHRVWVKPTAKATTTVSSSNVVTLTLSNVTEDVTTKTITGADPFEIDETSNVFVFEEPTKIGSVPYSVTVGTETYTNAVTATTEEIGDIETKTFHTDVIESNILYKHLNRANTAWQVSGSNDGNWITYSDGSDHPQFYKGSPESGYTLTQTVSNGQGGTGTLSYDGLYHIGNNHGNTNATLPILKRTGDTFAAHSSDLTKHASVNYGPIAWSPNSYNFAVTDSANEKIYFYEFDSSDETWSTTWNSGSLTSTIGDTSWFGRMSTRLSKDGEYLVTGDHSPENTRIFKCDWTAQTVTLQHTQTGNSGAAAIDYDGEYVIAGYNSANTKILKRSGTTWTDVTTSEGFTNLPYIRNGAQFLGVPSQYLLTGEYNTPGQTANQSHTFMYKWKGKKEVTLAFANPTLTLTGQNVTISSAKLYKDDVLFHTYGTESNVVLHSDQTGTYQAIVNDVYYSNRITPDFTTTRSVSAPQLEFDGYNKLTFENITPTSTTLGVPDGTTRDLTTQSNVYIYKSGTYTANVQTSDTFAYLSNVATTQALPTRLQGSDISAMGTTNYTRYGVPSSQSIDVEDFLFNSSSNINPCIDFIHLTNSQDTFVFDLESVKTINKIRIYAGNTTPNWASRNTGSVVKLYNGSTLVYTSPSLTFSRSSPETYYGPYEEGKDYNTLLFTTGYTNIDKITVETPSTSAALGRVEVNDFTDAPSLTFDGFNKLSIDNITQTSSTITYPNGSTVNTNTVSDVYIKDIGEYALEASDANTFVTSNVEVGALDTVPGFTAAFHHGAFSASDYSSAYSTVAEAATAGFVYSDTPAGDYTWGTLEARVKERENPDFTANSTLHTDYSSTYGWTNSGWAVSADSQHDNSEANYGAWKAFDKLNNTFWHSNHSSGVTSSTPATLTIQYPSSQVIKSYNITSRNDDSNTRFPSVWKLQGYDGSSWVDVGSEQTVTTWTPGATKRFDVSDNTTAYTKYQLRITTTIRSASATSTSDFAAIAAWKLYTLNNENNTVHDDHTEYTYTPPGTGTITANVLRVAGGGAGGNTRSGGGGAGGLLYSENVSVSGAKKIVVGNGGKGKIGNQQMGDKGHDTLFEGLTTVVGGGSAAGERPGTECGSSGGNSGRNTSAATAPYPSGQGNAGGTAGADNFNGAGGGGAGGVGANQSSGIGGIGLDYSSVFGTTYGESGWFAGGGGGGGGTRAGGQGGGGDGTQNGTPGPGQKHTGGGSGGKGNSENTNKMSDGGSGIVLIKKIGAANPPTLNFDGYNKLSIDNIVLSKNKIVLNELIPITSVAIDGTASNNVSYANHAWKCVEVHSDYLLFDHWNTSTNALDTTNLTTRQWKYTAADEIRDVGTDIPYRFRTKDSSGNLGSWYGSSSNDAVLPLSGFTGTIQHTHSYNNSYGGEFTWPGHTFSNVSSEVVIKKDGAAFATTTSNTVYIRDTGTYTAEVKGLSEYVTEVSKVVSGDITEFPNYVNATSFYYGGGVVDNTGKLYTWGHNAYGDSGRGASDRVPTHLSSISDPVSNVWRGDPGFTMAAKTSTDKWYMWGRNTYSGVLGNTTNTGNVTVPEDVTAKVTTYFGDQTVSANKILKIVMGSHHAAALTAGGKVWSWGGDNTYYATGTGTNNHTVLVTPVLLTTDGSTQLTGITDIQSTFDGTAAFDSSGNVWFWGGSNTSMQYAYPTKLLDSSSIPGIVGMTTNGKSIYAWKSDGTFYTRGAGTYGQLANGADNDQYTSWQTVTTLQGKTIKKVFGGNENMFAWTDDGVYGVGRNNNYKLGEGSLSSIRNIWHKSTTLSALSIKEIDFGHATGLVLTTDGKGYMWGEDASNSMANALSGHQSGAAEATSISALSLVHIPSPSITYDGKNKLTVGGTNYEDTATVTYYSNTYNLGTAKTMYVKDIGDYVFKISGTDKYVESNVYVSSVDLAGAPTKPIDFDGYNKLTLIDAGSNVSANVTYFSNTYELGSANVLYINGAGTYDLEMSGSNVFALSSNVVSGSVNSQRNATYKDFTYTETRIKSTWDNYDTTHSPPLDFTFKTGSDFNNSTLIGLGYTEGFNVSRWWIVSSDTHDFATHGTGTSVSHYNWGSDGTVAVNQGTEYAWFTRTIPSTVVDVSGTYKVNLGAQLTFDTYNKLTLENFTTIDIEWPPASFTSPTFSTSTVTGVTTTNNGRDQTWTISGASYGNGEYSASYNNTVLNNANYHGPVRCFDKVNDGYAFHSSSIQTGIVTLNMPEKILLDSYELRHRPNANTSENHAPRDWTFEASNDGTTWDVLDTQANQSYSPDVQGDEASKRTYTVSDNVTEYSRYRLNITANDGGAHLVIGQWKLFVRNPRTATLTDPNGDTYSLGQTQNDIYIKDQGDYFLEVTNSDQKAIVAKTMGTISTPPVINHVALTSGTSTFFNFSWSSNHTFYPSVITDTSVDISAIEIRRYHAPGENQNYDEPIDSYEKYLSWYSDSLHYYEYTNNGRANISVSHDRDTGGSWDNWGFCIHFTDGSKNYGAGRGITFNKPSQWFNNRSSYSINYTLDPSDEIYAPSSPKPPSLTFDTYNKLSIENLTPTSTTLTDPNGSSFDIGTASNVYIEDAGTYKVATGDATTFALVSNVVGAISDWETSNIFGFPLTSSIPSASNYSDVSTIVQGAHCEINNGSLKATNSSQSANDRTLYFHTTADYEEFTVTFDFNLSEVGSEDGVFFSAEDTASNMTVELQKYGANTIRPQIQSSLNPTFTQTSGFSDWAKLTFMAFNKTSSRPGRVKIYIDDVLKLNQEATTWTTSNLKFKYFTLLGGRPDGRWALPNARMKNFKFYNHTTLYDTGPTLTYDTSNKLSIENLTPTSTTLTDPNGSSFDIGTASNVYIRDSGKYSIASKDANTFVLTSNTVTGTPTGTYDKRIPLAFHHGTFANGGDPYSHGSVAAAATAGYVYSDTPTGTYSWGTLSSVTLTADPGDLEPTSSNSPGTAGKTEYKWTPPSAITNGRTLVVAGGGGGGTDMGGGGGAGGLLASTTTNIAKEEQTITVGGGGTRGLNASSFRPEGGNGGNSSISGPGITSIGGGGGTANENHGNANGVSGGSGGGGSGYGQNSGGTAGGAGTSGQGHAGASRNGNYYPGGGGGAGAAGSANPGHGGDGVENDILGTNYWWAGGGGGAGHSGRGGNGGKGGGGGGVAYNTTDTSLLGTNDTNGITTGTAPTLTSGHSNDTGGSAGKHTGGGGGGGEHNSVGDTTLMRGGRGGSGIVVIQVPTTVTIPSQVYDNTKTITVSNVPSGTSTVGKIYKGSTAYTIHATTSSSNVIIKNTGSYVSVFTTATQAFLTNAVNVNATPTTTSDDTTIEDAEPIVTTTTSTSIDTTLAFHYGSFDTVYGDADVEEAANNGRIFDDTPSSGTSYTWGTLDSTPSTASNQTTYTWTPTSDITGADVLMVAGGGGGGKQVGGGGGAGGLLHHTNQTLSGQKTIVVGDGGIGGDYSLNVPAYNGNNTTFTGFDNDAIGGGRGASYDGFSSGTGGSGGGGGGNSTTGQTGTSGQGNNGGSGRNSSWAGGGGGGAGAAGQGSPSNNVGGYGGAGLNKSSVFGTTYGDSGWFAGGGGGCGSGTNTVGAGGQGGGGQGGNTATVESGVRKAGTKHTGGGGGGTRDGNNFSGSSVSYALSQDGGKGGSGIVLVKFTAQVTTTTTTGGIAGSTAVPVETTTDTPSAVLDATDTTVTDPILDLDFTTTLPRNLKRYNTITSSSIGVRFNRHESKKKRIEKSINTDTFSIELTANNASSPTTLTVTVANSKFVINGDETPTLGFIRGETYTFDQSDASNSEHPLVLATSEDGATQYTTGWTTTPSSPDYVPGVSGAQGTFIVPYDVPDTIYYKCNVHSNMGGEINTTFGNVFSLGDFTVAANTHVSGEYTLATNYDGTTSNLYVNGDLITQITPSPVISAGVKEFILGKEFDGYVKNFKFWNYNFIPPYNRIPGTFQKNGINGNSTLYYLLGARAVEATPWYSTYHMPQSTSKADAFAITSGGTSIANGGVNTSRGTYPTIDPGLSIGSGHVVANSFHFATDMTKIDKIYFLSANGAYGLEFSLQDYADVPAPASGGGDVGGTITITDKFGYTATSIYALKRVSNAEDPWINTGTNHNYTQMFYGDSTGDAGGSHMSDNGGFYIYASLS